MRVPIKKYGKYLYFKNILFNFKLYKYIEFEIELNSFFSTII